jgi:tRNA pseudouridine55 synthase
MYSALKREGRPLYELARRGEHVERQPRKVRVERLDLISTGPQDLTVEVVCSKGTYVRVLAEDIARALGTCGHLGELRRPWVEPFEGEGMVTLDEIEAWATGGENAAPAPWLRAVDQAFTGLPRLTLDPLRSLHLCQGRLLEAPAGLVHAERARAYGADGRFLGLVKVGDDGQLRVERLFVPGAGGAQSPET